MKFVKKKCTLAMSSGEFEEVEGIAACNGLFIHRKAEDYWVVNHHSGLRLFAVGRLKHAKAAIIEISKLAIDWTGEGSQVQRQMREKDLTREYKTIYMYKYGGV